jgi:hypothetical protein
VVAHVHSKRPGLVVHVGDLTLDGTHDVSELGQARSLLDRLHTDPDAPQWFRPANHLLDTHSRDAEMGAVFRS